MGGRRSAHASPPAIALPAGQALSFADRRGPGPRPRRIFLQPSCNKRFSNEHAAGTSDQPHSFCHSPCLAPVVARTCCCTFVRAAQAAASAVAVQTSSFETTDDKAGVRIPGGHARDELLLVPWGRRPGRAFAGNQGAAAAATRRRRRLGAASQWRRVCRGSLLPGLALGPARGCRLALGARPHHRRRLVFVAGRLPLRSGGCLGVPLLEQEQGVTKAHGHLAGIWQKGARMSVSSCTYAWERGVGQGAMA